MTYAFMMPLASRPDQLLGRLLKEKEKKLQESAQKN
jgi:hypothetical protein